MHKISKLLGKCQVSWALGSQLLFRASFLPCFLVVLSCSGPSSPTNGSIVFQRCTHIPYFWERGGNSVWLTLHLYVILNSWRDCRADLFILCEWHSLFPFNFNHLFPTSITGCVAGLTCQWYETGRKLVFHVWMLTPKKFLRVVLVGSDQKGLLVIWLVPDWPPTLYSGHQLCTVHRLA